MKTLLDTCGIISLYSPGGEEKRIYRDDETNQLWEKHYTALSAGYPGALGGILNRAEAQVFRLSILYAVLDASKAIKKEHLTAALAVWDYSVRSAKWIFGDSTGNWRSDKILWELQRSPNGLSRTVIMKDVLQKNATKIDLDQALSVLVVNKLAVPHDICDGKYHTELWKLKTQEQ